MGVTATAQQPFDYGNLWKHMSDNERYYYVNGFQEGGLRLAVFQAYLDGSLRAERSRQIAALGLTKAQRDALARIVGDDFQRIAVERFGSDVVSRVITDLYVDPANALIPFANVLTVAMMRLGGKTAAQVAEELSMFRQVFSRARETKRR